MPAQVVLVHDEEAFSADVRRALADSGYEVMAFPDPLVALQALETAERVVLLITRIEFPEGRSNGQALALMAKKARPGVKVLFVCPPRFNRYVADLGEVLLAPATVPDVVETALRLFPPPQAAR